MTQDDLAYINKVTMTGYVVRDPEFRHTTSGTPVSNFRIAATKRYADADGKPREEICYVGIAAWNDLAENCRDFLVKGSAVQVDGELKSRVRESGDGVRRSFVEIRANKIRVFKAEGETLNLEDTGDRIGVPSGAEPSVLVNHRLRETGPADDREGSACHPAESHRDEVESFNTSDREEL